MTNSSSPENTMTRRKFLDRSATAVVGAALLGDAATAGANSLSAISYGRVIGANDRIHLGHVGIGQRGRGLEYILSQLKDSKNVEVVRLCDLWKVNLEQAVAKSNEIYGRTRRSSQIFEDVLGSRQTRLCRKTYGQCVGGGENRARRRARAGAHRAGGNAALQRALPD